MISLDLAAPVRLRAPAKLNLGLEVLGRRPDGYHEVLTILQTVSLFDVIDLIPAPALAYTPPEGRPRDDDLLWRAVQLAERAFGVRLRAELRLEKHIPIAAGLGGGSSDAGTLLGAIAALAGIAVEAAERAAARLGSDVPFFVRGGTALASGTGTTLSPLPPLRDAWFVVVVPPLAIPAKTATLYGALTPEHYSDGHATRQQAQRLARGEPLDLALLRNAFTPTLARWEPVRQAMQALRDAGAPVVIPSGAGPAIFTVLPTEDAAAAVARRVPPACGRTLVCTAVEPDRPSPLADTHLP
ncbi:MAG: 4-(cytidine 5'-diphospho)-2-C-methyl-D-erythritol kinase [Sphaerobacter sp.]|nr:4-(cytidine 5'-diphospho)-2-C-methyl-D-erythritol kinase [Sphaerobacter sp.]